MEKRIWVTRVATGSLAPLFEGKHAVGDSFRVSEEYAQGLLRDFPEVFVLGGSDDAETAAQELDWSGGQIQPPDVPPNPKPMTAEDLKSAKQWLLQLPGIGARLAPKLLEAGLHSREALLDPANRDEVERIVPRHCLGRMWSALQENE